MSAEVNQNKQYGIGLDILRILAMFFVIMVHSTTFYGFSNEELTSVGIFFAGFSRYLSYSCVPIFLLLTGYLNCHKKPTLKYYLKLIKFLIEYLLCGVVVFAFNNLFANSSMSFLDLASGLLNFTFPEYAWYIDMFVGLFMLAPFLNYIVKAISNKQKIILIIILILTLSNFKITLYWSIAYPLLYYFIGAILRDTKINIKKITLTCIAIATILIQILQSKFNIIPRYSTENYFNIGCIVISASIFLLFRNITISSDKKSLIKPLRTIANASLSTYLVSVIFETLTTQYFEKINVVTYSERFPYLLYLTPVKFIFSVICGIVISLISSLIFKGIMYLVEKNTKVFAEKG